jgi:diguanylate cyclase (GGDEF)-like protein
VRRIRGVLAPRRRAYTVAGILLGVLGPAGLAGMQASFGVGPFAGAWSSTELATEVLTYGYVLAYSMIVLGVLGWHVGRRQDELEITSTTDPLTGLPNRRVFVRRAHEEAKRAARYNAPTSLLLIDLDELKTINDTHGHARGDAVLRAIGECLRTTCRETELAARCGGDEFAVLVPETRAESAIELAKRIQSQFSELWRARGEEPAQVSVSIGVADVERSAGASREALLEAADRALYVAKASGKNRVVLAPAQRRRRERIPSTRLSAS